MTMRTDLPKAKGRRTHSTGPRRSTRAYRRRAAPRVHPSHPQGARRGAALRLLGTLADALAAEGIEIRGALARAVKPKEPPPATPAEQTSEVPFVARFEIPTTANDGTPFSMAVLLPILRDLYERMGGATVADAVGVWRERSNAFCLDISLTVEVWTTDQEGLVAFLERVRRDLDQDAIVLRITRPEFVWIKRRERAP